MHPAWTENGKQTKGLHFTRLDGDIMLAQDKVKSTLAQMALAGVRR
jgi:hypothetical protein